jgi:signal peptidase I
MWYIILGLLSLVSLTINFLIGGGYTETYIIRPALWIALAVITFLVAKNEGVNFLKFKKIRRWSLGKSPIHAGLMLGGFQVALLIIIGVFFKFGKSPYAFTPTVMITNAFFIGSILIGTEFSRAYLIKKTTKNQRKYTTLAILIITIIYTLILISPNRFASLNLDNPVKTLEFLGGTIIVGIATSLLATYLAYLGGATASISYMGVLLAFEWFSPILPNPHWIVLALVGTIAPAAGFIILQASITPGQTKPKGYKRKKQKSDHGWTTIAIFTVILLFFSYGYLGVEPTVIYSGSMQPELNVGDIVLIDNVKPEEIQVGDVIQYVREDKTLILHRVIERYEDEKGQLFFITQGDANPSPDPTPVLHKNVRGRAGYTIPKIGWIQIYVKNLFRSATAPITQ